MDRGAWRATVPGVAKSRTRLSDLALRNSWLYSRQLALPAPWGSLLWMWIPCGGSKNITKALLEILTPTTQAWSQVFSSNRQIWSQSPGSDWQRWMEDAEKMEARTMGASGSREWGTTSHHGPHAQNNSPTRGALSLQEETFRCPRRKMKFKGWLSNTETVHSEHPKGETKGCGCPEGWCRRSWVGPGLAKPGTARGAPQMAHLQTGTLRACSWGLHCVWDRNLGGWHPRPLPSTFGKGRCWRDEAAPIQVTGPFFWRMQRILS